MTLSICGVTNAPKVFVYQKCLLHLKYKWSCDNNSKCVIPWLNWCIGIIFLFSPLPSVFFDSISYIVNFYWDECLGVLNHPL